MEVEVMRSHENRYGIQLQVVIMNAFMNYEIPQTIENGTTRGRVLILKKKLMLYTKYVPYGRYEC